MDDFTPYMVLRSQGAAAHDVYRVAKANGLDLASSSRMLRQVFKLDLTQATEVMLRVDTDSQGTNPMDDFTPYRTMRDQGVSMQDVYRAAKANGLIPATSIRMLRQVFNLTLEQAIEVTVQVDTGVASLSEYYERIASIFGQKIEEHASHDGSGKRKQGEWLSFRDRVQPQQRGRVTVRVAVLALVICIQLIYLIVSLLFQR